MTATTLEARPPRAAGPFTPGRPGTVGRRQRRTAYMLLAPCVVVLLALAIFPLFYSGTLSFRVDPLYNPDVARFVGWRNYEDLFDDSGSGTASG